MLILALHLLTLALLMNRAIVFFINKTPSKQKRRHEIPIDFDIFFPKQQQQNQVYTEIYPRVSDAVHCKKLWPK